MSLYERYVLPHLIHLACGNEAVAKQRGKVVPKAEGRVLEVGMGSGLNLPFYNRNKVDLIWGLEPSEGMRRKAHKRVRQSNVPVEWLGLPSEQIPLDDDSADTIVLTYTLCTIPDWRQALAEMRRVLKPSGSMVFSEHGEAPEARVQKWQGRINPLWNRLAGGCHLNRQIPRLLDEGGFRTEQIDTLYLPGPQWATFNYWGVARTR